MRTAPSDIISIPLKQSQARGPCRCTPPPDLDNDAYRSLRNTPMAPYTATKAAATIPRMRTNGDGYVPSYSSVIAFPSKRRGDGDAPTVYSKHSAQPG